MTIFSLDSIIDGMQLVTRGIKTAMDADSPDDLNPEDNGKIEEFAHAYMASRCLCKQLLPTAKSEQ